MARIIAGHFPVAKNISKKAHSLIGLGTDLLCILLRGFFRVLSDRSPYHFFASSQPVRRNQSTTILRTIADSDLSCEAATASKAARSSRFHRIPTGACLIILQKVFKVY